MHQDYRLLPLDGLELLEKQTLRMIVQALQQYSREAKEIFERTPAASGSEVIVLAEDLVQYALEVAEVYPINKRFAGFIDYKRARWLPTGDGLFPQVLLVDAKASTENNRDTLQQSQLPMDADFRTSNGKMVHLPAGVSPHMEIEAADGQPLHAVTTSIFIHFYYRDLASPVPPYRELMDIYVLAVPHNRLKERYNPDATTGFFGQGKHSPARGEEPRIRVYFNRLRGACPWRLQQLTYAGSTDGYTAASWRDVDAAGMEVNQPFLYLPR
ncbi:SfiI family type II restriction endonuclease [Geodermatophilus sp. SYSU D00700]